MNKQIRWIIVGLVGVAVALTLVLKPSGEVVTTATNSERPKTAGAAASVAASAKVVLVADPREANSSCGCGALIRAAREAGTMDGVEFQEIDPRTGRDAMASLGVLTAPTVLVWSTLEGEPQRFEGESSEVIAQVQGALAALPVPGKSG